VGRRIARYEEALKFHICDNAINSLRDAQNKCHQRQDVKKEGLKGAIAYILEKKISISRRVREAISRETIDFPRIWFRINVT